MTAQIAIIVTIALALVTWLVYALLGWGKTIGSLQKDIGVIQANQLTLSKQHEALAMNLQDVRRDMLKPEHLENAMLKARLGTLQEMVSASRAADAKGTG